VRAHQGPRGDYLERRRGVSRRQQIGGRLAMGARAATLVPGASTGCASGAPTTRGGNLAGADARCAIVEPAEARRQIVAAIERLDAGLGRASDAPLPWSAALVAANRRATAARTRLSALLTRLDTE